ncbi:MAG: DEAD/DEAH box helicase, partial [Muribaculaceae bacterium]|nr:DEAD/DEAH box helicase [Muribaculaceae bacterium]
MARRNRNSKANKQNNKPKVSPMRRTEGETLEQWQSSLRVQAAKDGMFGVTPSAESRGTYTVVSPVSRSEYKVVYRGPESNWNYCSCMDFKTNQLGTCKHLEAVKLWIDRGNHRVYSTPPAYSSIYLAYGPKRELRLRIGSDDAEAIEKAATPYFTKRGVLRSGAEKRIATFIGKATKINSSFRVYPDAMDYLTAKRDAETRRMMLDKLKDKDIDNLLKTTLYPYQREGIRFAFKAGRSIIADEMGLGKTVQAIGTAELMRNQGLISSVLIVCPTSLKYQWKKEIERFTGSTVNVIEGAHHRRREQYRGDEFYKIVSYNAVSNDIKIMNSLTGFDLVIFDEVQRLKNWNTQIARSARRIRSDYTVALSGTPLENKLEELYSVMQLVDQYLLGPLYKFLDNCIITNESGKIVGYRNLNEVGKIVSEVLIRRTKAEVALQLPKRIDQILFVPMTQPQRDMHEDFKASVAKIVHKWKTYHFLSEADRRRMLLLLSQMRMVCDSTFILDQKTRHDTKVDEIINIINTAIENGDEKIVIFSQWERMTRIIAAQLNKMGIDYEYLHGGVPSEKRRELTENFTENPESRVFISTDAGSTGLNLQIASIIINVDLPWNPAVLEQRIGRIYRIGQKRNIQVINLVSGDTIEERMLSTLDFKSNLFKGILGNGDDTVFLDNSKLEKIMDVVQGFATTTIDEADNV